MTIPAICKILLLVAFLRDLDNQSNAVVDCLRGDTSSARRRLGWERAGNTLPQQSHNYHVEVSEEVVELHEEVAGAHDNEYLDDFYAKDDDVEEIDDFYEVKDGKSYIDNYFFKEGTDVDEYPYGKGGKSGKSGKSVKSTKSKKSEKYTKDWKKSKYHYEEIIVVNDDKYEYDDDVVTYYSKSGKAGQRPNFPDFEYIDCDYNIYADDSYGKGYYSKTGKNEKTSKSGKLCGPVKRPTLKHHLSPHSGSNDEPSIRPPLSPTSKPAPTLSPAPAEPTTSKTFEPTYLGSYSVGVPTFALAYKLLNDDEPKTTELKELEKATETYLSEYFFNEFDGDGFTVLFSFNTDLLDFSYTKGRPVVTDYKSYARFSDTSTITPTSEQMASAVAEAFTGLNMMKYEDRLGDLLPSNNIFSGSEVQFYQEGGEAVFDSTRQGIGATGIAASAVAFTLLVAGFVIYKRKSDSDRFDDIDKLHCSPGDVTVAGETIACETYDGTASVSAASLDYVRRYDEEEVGNKVANLISIPENDNINSVKPVSNEVVDDDDNYEENIRIRHAAMTSPRSPGEMIFQKRAMSTSFEEVALQAPTHGRFQRTIMSDPSTSEDDNSQMSESELSQFMTSRQDDDDQASASHTLEIKSLLSMDSAEDYNTPSISGGLSVRDNSSRRLRTVAEIEALLSSDLKNTDTILASSTFIRKQGEQKQSRPRTVEEIESLLTADNDDDTITELPFSDEDESIID